AAACLEGDFGQAGGQGHSHLHSDGGRDRADSCCARRPSGGVVRGVPAASRGDRRTAARQPHRLGRRRPGRHRQQDLRAGAGNLAGQQHPGADQPGRPRDGTARRGHLRLVRTVRQRDPGRAARRLPVRYPVRDLQTTGGATLNPDEAPAATQTGSRRRAVSVLAVVAAVTVLVDLATKQLTVAHLADAEPVRLLGGAVYLVHTTNSGAAFGIGKSYTFVFPIVAVAVAGWIAWMALRLRSLPWATSLALVLGG